MNLEHILSSLEGKHILGINPPVHDFAYFDLWSKPLGLLFLLQQMRDQGNSVHLIDCVDEARGTPKPYGRFKTLRQGIPKPEPYKDIERKYYHFGLDEVSFKKRLSELPRPDYILLTSGMTYWYPGVAWAIRQIRAVHPAAPLFLGGTYARLCPDHARTLGADEVQTEPMDIRAAFPAMDLYPKPEYGVFLTSFGCPLSCDYCASRQLWPHFKRRQAEELRQDFLFQKNLGITDMSLYDDALLIDKEKHFYPLCETLLADSRLRFHTPNGLHVRQIDAYCAHLLHTSGFKTIRLSLEGIDPQTAQASSGKVALHEYQESVHHLINAGYTGEDLETYILAGLPGQSEASVCNSIRLVHSLGGKPKIAEYSPIPGTPLFETAAQTLPLLREEPLLHNNSVYSTHIARNLSPETLQGLKKLSRNPDTIP